MNWFFLNEGTVQDCSRATGISEQRVELVITENVPGYVKGNWTKVEPRDNGTFRFVPNQKWVDRACRENWKGYEINRILARHQMAPTGEGKAADTGPMPTVLDVTITCPGCRRRCCATIPSLIKADSFRYGACGLQFRGHKFTGYVCVLSNPEMPSLVKIGRSNQVGQRAKELSRATGVPADFVPEAMFASRSPEEHEAEIKRVLRVKRLSGKEFFEIDLATAIRTVQAVVGTPPINPRDNSLEWTPRSGGSATSGGAEAA